jgi:hypothetical protein
MKTMPKNNIATQGYFIKRLRDAGYYIIRMFDNYAEDDKRKWTVIINPSTDSILLTCIDNGEWPYRGLYRLDDDNKLLPHNFYINTESVDVILKHLKEFNIDKKDPININNAGKKRS